VSPGFPAPPPEWARSWRLLQALLQFAGFAGVTVAAGLGLRSLLGRPGAGLEDRALRWTRAGFLLLGGALAAGALRSQSLGGGLWPEGREAWGLVAWLTFFAVLHVHRVKAFRGRTAAAAGLGGWILAALAWLALR
jgi:ABC-type transport system involved in cytochrome c biogenesis permease subunit